MMLKYSTQYASKFGKISSGPRTGEKKKKKKTKSHFIAITKKGNTKECANYCTIALILHASNVMLKILQARIAQYMNQEHPDV